MFRGQKHNYEVFPAQLRSSNVLSFVYRQHKTLWYQFCNFKHFPKVENSEDSLASLCEEFWIGFHVIQYEAEFILER